MSKRQEGGDNSQNVQADTVIYQSGISAAEARELALDVYRANALELRGVAARIAQERVETFIDDFLERLSARGTNTLSALQDPDVQHDIYTAQRDYARSGDESLGQTLIDLLIDRCETPGRELRGIVLNEALSAVAKITEKEIAALTVRWLITSVLQEGLTSPGDLVSWLMANVQPFVTSIPTARVNYEHIEYVGCGTIQIGSSAFGRVMSGKHPGLFAKGVKASDISETLTGHWDNPDIFRPCFHDGSLKQVNAARVEEAAAKEEKHGIPNEELSSLLTRNVMDESRITEWFSEQHEQLALLVSRWQEATIHSLQLTTVGVAIAHANWRRVTGQDAPLSVWIPDGS